MAIEILSAKWRPMKNIERNVILYEMAKAW